jgi:hypothetical protein
MKNVKWIYVKFDRDTWKIPARIVAIYRAHYYACVVDGHNIHSPEFNKEFQISMEDENLIEWAKNSMNWVDVKEFAQFVTFIDERNYSEMWSNADMEIVTEND